MLFIITIKKRGLYYMSMARILPTSLAFTAALAAGIATAQEGDFRHIDVMRDNINSACTDFASDAGQERCVAAAQSEAESIGEEWEKSINAFIDYGVSGETVSGLNAHINDMAIPCTNMMRTEFASVQAYGYYFTQNGADCLNLINEGREDFPDIQTDLTDRDFEAMLGVISQMRYHLVHGR